MKTEKTELRSNDFPVWDVNTAKINRGQSERILEFMRTKVDMNKQLISVYDMIARGVELPTWEEEIDSKTNPIVSATSEFTH